MQTPTFFFCNNIISTFPSKNFYCGHSSLFFFFLATSQYFRSALSNDTSCHLLIQFLTIAWTHSASHFHHILWNFPFYLFLYFLFFLFHILHISRFSSDQISISNVFVYCLPCLFNSLQLLFSSHSLSFQLLLSSSHLFIFLLKRSMHMLISRYIKFDVFMQLSPSHA